jgi:hypothetical protein
MVGDKVRGAGSCRAAQKPNHRHCRLLRPRRERPSGRRAAEQRDEVAHLVGARGEPGRHVGPKCFGGLQVDQEFELGSLIDWQVGRRGAIVLVFETLSPGGNAATAGGRTRYEAP